MIQSRMACIRFSHNLHEGLTYLHVWLQGLVMGVQRHAIPKMISNFSLASTLQVILQLCLGYSKRLHQIGASRALVIALNHCYWWTPCLFLGGAQGFNVETGTSCLQLLLSWHLMSRVSILPHAIPSNTTMIDWWRAGFERLSYVLWQETSKTCWDGN